MSRRVTIAISSSRRARPPCASPSEGPVRSCGRPCTKSVPGASLASPRVAAMARATVSSRWKGVKVRRTSPRASSSVPAPAPPQRVRDQSLPSRQGARCTPSMPPSRPLAGRLRSRTAPLGTAGRRAPRRVGLRPWLGLAGRSRPPRGALQHAINGQTRSAAPRGGQTVAPRSISAWAQSPGRVRDSPAASALLGLASGMASSIAKSRAITRSTLPSTARPAGRRRSRATAAAV